MTLDPGEYLQSLAADSQAIVDMAGPVLDRTVPACPGWTVADVIGHLGGVYSWTAAAVSADGEKPSGRRRPPEERGALVSWFSEQRAELMDVLTTREPAVPAWNFVHGSSGTVGWWRRRQAMETSIHLWDIQQAAGTEGAIEPVLASDGVDEVISEFLPDWYERNPGAGPTGTLHLHCTDTDGEWMLDLSAPGLDIRREHGKAATALRGPAEGLLLWAWNRRAARDAGLELFGDEALLTGWRAIKL